ncbi:MAG: hypothetical protein J6Q40_05770 [Tidjanibacter sp.]|nr:hypothetical protein [Tidjanibacter sp.]
MPALFFMAATEVECSDRIGNEELFDRYSVGLFAPTEPLADAEEALCRWVDEVSQRDVVVVSGFHSPLEKMALELLLAAGCSVVMVLGRALYKKIPAMLKKPFDEGRVLIVSASPSARHSYRSGQTRNWYIADNVRELVFMPFSPDSALSTLHYTFSRYSAIPIRIL